MDYFLFDFSGVQFHYTMSQQLFYLRLSAAPAWAADKLPQYFVVKITVRP